MSLLRAWVTLFWLSFRRLLWSTSTLMVLLPMAGGTLFLLRRRYDLIGDYDRAFQLFSEFVIIVFVAFLVPICALAYGTSSVGADREDRTLLFLLIRPIPRWLVLSAKVAAALPLALGLVVLCFRLYCALAGPAGELAYQLFLPAVTYSTLAYLGLFHLFAVSLPHSTIVALIYALFFEFLLGNMPGIVKRVAVNYYGRSLMYAVGATDGLQRPGWFEPISVDAAGWTLAGIAVGSLLLAAIVFQFREYRDLT
ncbi:MAG TPA: ABC transporter permease subunit [Pirellulales bacterium]|nr:ABC transporter permease subunit [Pirellulales bacterium]